MGILQAHTGTIYIGCIGLISVHVCTCTHPPVALSLFFFISCSSNRCVQCRRHPPRLRLSHPNRHCHRCKAMPLILSPLYGHRALRAKLPLLVTTFHLYLLTRLLPQHNPPTTPSPLPAWVGTIHLECLLTSGHL